MNKRYRLGEIEEAVRMISLLMENSFISWSIRNITDRLPISS